jgi:hypothetical protein
VTVIGSWRGTNVALSGLRPRIALESDPGHCDCGDRMVWQPPCPPTAPTIRRRFFFGEDVNAGRFSTRSVGDSPPIIQRQSRSESSDNQGKKSVGGDTEGSFQDLV